MADQETSPHSVGSRNLYGSSQELLFGGLPTFMRRHYSRNLDGVDIAVLGVPCDLATSFRPGARFGPSGIRKASVDMAWWDKQFYWDFNPFNRLAIVDYGDVQYEYGNPADMVDKVHREVADILSQGSEVLCLGGDHFISLPVIRAHAEVHGPLSLVHFDAHTDTDSNGNTYDHGSMFYHAVAEGIVDPERSVQIGIRTEYDKSVDQFVVLDAPWIHENGTAKTIKRIREVVAENKAYLTFDIDCLDPAFAPGTGTPVIGGLSSSQALAIMRGCVDINFVGMDMVEVAPDYDVSAITAFAAAQLTLEYLCVKASARVDVV